MQWFYLHLRSLMKILRFPANIYLFKVNNRNTRKRREICSKLTIKTPEGHYWRRSGVFIVNFEHILRLFIMFLLLTLNKSMLAQLFYWKLICVCFLYVLCVHLLFFCCCLIVYSFTQFIDSIFQESFCQFWWRSYSTD